MKHRCELLVCGSYLELFEYRIHLHKSMHYNDEMLPPIFVTGTPRRGKSCVESTVRRTLSIALSMFDVPSFAWDVYVVAEKQEV